MKNTIEQSANPNHLLLIEYGFRNLIENNRDVGIAFREVKTGNVHNGEVVRESIAFASMVEKSTNADIENIRKCTGFINERFPHALYSFDEFGIEIENLSEYEMRICALEPGIKFTYWLVDDQEIILEEHLNPK